MSDETAVLRKIWLSVASKVTLFRLNTGQAWVGKGKPTRLADGSVVLPFARPITVGFSDPQTKSIVGVGDLIGWTTITITQEMVGKKIAIFTSLECKNSKGGITSTEQKKWALNVRNSGGIAMNANDPEKAKEKVQEELFKIHDKIT